MQRPLMRYGVGQLEEMFANGKADVKILKELEQELRCRQVPRAVALLEKVQAVLNGNAGVPSAPIQEAFSLTSGAEKKVPQPEIVRKRIEPFGEAPKTPAGDVVRANSRAVASSSANAPHVILPLDEAYKILNASQVTPWQSIEQTRRSLVSLSHPARLKAMSAEQRSRALSEAKRVNFAYSTISRNRCGGK